MKTCAAAFALAACTAPFTAATAGQGPDRGNQPPGPTITVRGQTFTQQSLFRRNVGSAEDQTAQYPPHKIVGNLYYVGTRSLSTFLVATPQGHILINSNYERNVPTIQKSIEQLGFKFADVKIVLGSHAHADHMEGDALIKQLTGAQVMAMAEDVSALQAMRPGGKEHPVDRILRDGESVTVGGTSLIARLTPGHTRGNTTWTMAAVEDGKPYDVVIIGSFGTNPGVRLVNNATVPNIVDEFERTFEVARSLRCDIPLGSHPGMFNMEAKHARLAAGGPNPYLDPEGYRLEVEIAEAMFRAVLAEQQKEVAPSR